MPTTSTATGASFSFIRIRATRPCDDDDDDESECGLFLDAALRTEGVECDAAFSWQGVVNIAGGLRNEGLSNKDRHDCECFASKILN